MVDYEKLFTKIEKYNPNLDPEPIKIAYELAKDLHSDQYRVSGELFFSHPFQVAEILADLHMDTPTIVAGLLHDVVEDTEISLDEIRLQVGDEVCALIDGVTKLGRIEFRSREEQQAENLRKMLVAMAKDVRVIIIKLADRLHNMRTLHHMPVEKQREKARETLEIYAPLAHRLGIMQIKWELEDLAFERLEPKMYKHIQRLVNEKRSWREEYLRSFIEQLEEELKAVNIETEISGRPKHFYSIYRKMVKGGKEFSEIYDLSAIRVIVKSIKDCYGALGTIHTLWKPIPGRFKDYIAMPKFNMYQSLHTTVVGPGGRPLEIQIRTEQMHRTAEYGIAAHWKYKEGVKETREGKFDERLAWLRQMLEWQNELKDPREFMETLKIDLFQDEVYVFTPKGDVYSLQRGATPLDFAYSVHTDVGHHCVGAKVNNQIVSLGYELRTGDFVEILTSKVSTGPSQDWLKIVKTSRARNKIKQWFSKESREVNVSLGRDYIHKEMRKLGMGLHQTANADLLEKIAKEFNYKTVDDLFGGAGGGKVSAKQVASKIFSALTVTEEKDEPDEIRIEAPRKRITRPTKSGIQVKGVDDVLIRLAHCCNPVPYDEIIGFITRGRGVSVHRKDCSNAIQLLQQPSRLIDVSWDSKQPAAFKVEIQVEAVDRPKLLRDISTVMGDAGLNIVSASVNASRGHIAALRFIFEVGDLGHLKQVMETIKRVDSVIDVFRVESGKEAKIKGEVTSSK